MLVSTSSFGSAVLHIELDRQDASSPTWERPTFVAVRHLPGSDDDVIQVLGVGGGTVSYRLLLDSSEWSALQAMLLSVDTLTVAGASMGSALLEELAGPVQRIDGYVTVEGRFRLVTA